MKRRHTLLSALLVICLLAGLLPTTSFAATGMTDTYDLWVGGVQVTDENRNDITAAINKVAQEVASGSASFNPETNTLILEDFVYTGEGHDFEHTGMQSGAAVYSDLPVLNITANGTNALTHDAEDCMSYGIYTTGRLIVTEQSTGTITAVADEENLTNARSARSVGVFTVNDDIIVNGGTLIGKGGNTAIESGRLSTGVWCSSGNISVNHSGQLIGHGGSSNISRGICASAKLTVNGGTVTGTGGEGGSISHGISIGSLESNSESSRITGRAGSATERMSTSESIGIFVWNDSVFSKGYIIGTGSECPSGTSYGMHFNSEFTIGGGIVAAQGENGAFSISPVIDARFREAGIWYGENEAEADASGAKRKTVLADNYEQKYVRVASANLPPFDVSVSSKILHLTEGTIHKNPDAKLTAAYIDVPDNPSVSYTYQWYACDENGNNRTAVVDSDDIDHTYHISEELAPGTYYYVCEVSGYDYNSSFVASVSTDVVKVEVSAGTPVVIFDPDFGSFAEMGSVTIEVPISEGKLEENVPRPAAEGYMFVGWYTKDHEFISDPADYTFAHTTRLYARYSVMHTAIFDANGGVFEDGTSQYSVTFTEDALDKDKVPSEPTRKGYVFQGWYYKDAEGTEHKLELQPGLEYYELIGDFRFYAKWSKVAPDSTDTPTPPDQSEPTDTPEPTPTLEPEDNPDTGDDTTPGLWIGIMMIAFAGLGACTVVWRRKTRH